MNADDDNEDEDDDIACRMARRIDWGRAWINHQLWQTFAVVVAGGPATSSSWSLFIRYTLFPSSSDLGRSKICWETDKETTAMLVLRWRRGGENQLVQGPVRREPRDLFITGKLGGGFQMIVRTAAVLPLQRSRRGDQSVDGGVGGWRGRRRQPGVGLMQADLDSRHQKPLVGSHVSGGRVDAYVALPAQQCSVL